MTTRSISSPPDVEPPRALDAFAPIVFEVRSGGYIAKLNVIELGEVHPHYGGRHVRAWWSSRLPGGPNCKPATSMESARERLAMHIRDWFAACGIAFPEAPR